MQTVPSLVGTGTAIAAAASGLVFGQAIDQSHEIKYEIPATACPGARVHKRTTSIDRALPTHSPAALSSRISTLPSRRPATSSVASRSTGSELHLLAGSVHQTTRPPLSRRQRPLNPPVTPSIASSRRPSLAGDHWNLASPNVFVAQESKESLTWKNSWLKRLSIRPLSQHGSPRSGIQADSTSFTFSHGPAAPIPSPSRSASKPLSPNKLVKRSLSGNKQAGDGPSRTSKGHLPSLRRPATSRQRSATLQQVRAEIDVACSSPHPKYSFDEPIRPEELLGASPIEDLDQSPRTRRAIRKSGWASFFHSKTGQIETKANSQGRVRSYSDAAFRGKGIILKRIHPGNSLSCSAGAHLVKPRMVSTSSTVSGSLVSYHLEEGDASGKGRRPKDGMESPPRSEVISEVAASTRSKRSFSCSFSHTANWASSKATAPGGLRSSRRGATQPSYSGGGGDKQRHVSAPHAAVGRRHGSRSKPQRDTSSPPPPFSNHFAALQGESSRMMSPVPGGASYSVRPNQPSGSSTSSAGVAVSQRRGSQYARSPAPDGFDGEARDLNSGDEDDTDCKSDAVFDSVRTVGSGRVRAVETPLESVYDESPPSSTGGKKKPPRLSLQVMLDRTWNEDKRIMEEDETVATSIWAAQRSAHTKAPKRGQRNDNQCGLEPSLSCDAHSIAHDAGRVTLADDFDEDWTRDEDDNTLFNASSPPSKRNSLHSNDANLNPVTPSRSGLAHPERSLGNLFDWSEPCAHGKHKPTGAALRPQTAYGKQHGDSRGGRSAVRKGPVPTHVRSQSVPVVHEVAEDSKLTGYKYSTWGLGTKTVSEDWDEDFEFAGENGGAGGVDNQDQFAVPESIRASQPSVKAHSGQIRELSLLVNDLKRLCRHGRELNMLSADHKSVWKEAEGIIALASPDEDHVHDDDDQSGSSVYMDAFELNDSPVDEDLADVPVDLLDAVLERNEPAMSKTAVVRERQSPRRRSVFSPDDDIFGSSRPLTDGRPTHSNRPSPPRTPEDRPTRSQDVNWIVRSVIETMQNRSIISAAECKSTQAQDAQRSYNATNRMHFDTNSLKALVKRAGELRDILSDMVRKADQLTQSPIRTPRHDRHLDSSPAFTRVFDDPGSSPARRSMRTPGSSTGLVDCPSPEKSPVPDMGRRVPLMTVN